MAEIIAFEIYQTKALTLMGDEFMVHFTKRKDGEEYALFAVNSSKTQNWQRFYSPKTAAYLNSCTRQMLESKVESIIRGDGGGSEIVAPEESPEPA